jgi:hypothetical protein
MSSNDRDSANCYFSVSDKDDRTLWIYASPQGKELRVAGEQIEFGLDLRPGTSMDDAARLAELLREHVAQVSVWTIDRV